MTTATQRLEETDSLDIDFDAIDLGLPSDEELFELEAIAVYELENWLTGLEIEG